MNETLRAHARRMLITDEGVRKVPYRCSAGHWTVGVGRNLDSMRLAEKERQFFFDTPIDEYTIIRFLDEDIDRANDAASRIFGPDFELFSDCQKLAVINMIFNLGETGFRKFTKMVDSIKHQDWISASVHARLSGWCSELGHFQGRDLIGGRAYRVIELFHNRNRYA